MMWRDQIEARTNAANMSAMWKHLNCQRKTQTFQARSTDSERLLSAACEEEEVVDAGCCDDWNREMASND